MDHSPSQWNSGAPLISCPEHIPASTAWTCHPMNPLTNSGINFRWRLRTRRALMGLIRLQKTKLWCLIHHSS
ncbi:neural precursor cell expressed, developmentally down-regulated gene 4A, isoform CRA_a [Rattus norvegicus]|uniref:Neural cell expressed, developmentally down-regulated gene 4A, isoform CRA_a n=1 Tax=Rattus norvegicus TaxID=10116 RepID=A6KEM5_RAT|nr:neural precursor cell expressed, developmentally down-regulated gene 4A, isoform CRA_a [Rattus norvegicus]